MERNYFFQPSDKIVRVRLMQPDEISFRPSETRVTHLRSSISVYVYDVFSFFFALTCHFEILQNFVDIGVLLDGVLIRSDLDCRRRQITVLNK